MQGFVVVVAKHGRALPPRLDAVLGDEDLADLHFLPTRHHRWVSRSGDVRWAGWARPEPAIGLDEPWCEGPDGSLWTAAGHLWPCAGGAPADAVAQLRDHVRTPRALVAASGGLRGVFTAAALDPDGHGAVLTDPVSVSCLYWAEDDDLVAVASHPRLAARVLAGPGARLPRDAQGTGWLAALGYPIGERTGFTGVRVLPPGAAVELGPRWGARIRRRPAPWEADVLPDGDDAALHAAVHDDLLRAVETIAALPGERLEADLTGGRDTRLVLALLLEAGVTERFRFRTMGREGAADVIVARDLADRFGLEHRVLHMEPMPDPRFEARLLTHTFQYSGMLNVWDLKGSLAPPGPPTVTGLLEVLRTNHPGLPAAATRDDLLQRVARGVRLDLLSLLQPDARRAYGEELEAAVADDLGAPGASPHDRADAFYLHHRLRRWAGLEPAFGGWGRLYPLCSPVAVGAAFALGPTARRLGAVPFEAMRRACDELAQLPFAGKRWAPELLRGVPRGRRYASDPVADDPDLATSWKASRLDENRAVVTSLLLDDPGNPVFELLDRRAVEAALASPTPLDPQAQQQLFGALTCAIWLGGHEHPDRIGGAATEPGARVAVAPVRTEPRLVEGDRLHALGQVPTAPRRQPGVRESARALGRAVGRSARSRVRRLLRRGSVRRG